jgi:hypothetical protein
VAVAASLAASPEINVNIDFSWPGYSDLNAVRDALYRRGIQHVRDSIDSPGEQAKFIRDHVMRTLI